MPDKVNLEETARRLALALSMKNMKAVETLGGWRSDYVMRSHYMHSMRDKETAATVEKSLSFFMTSVTSGVTSMTSKTL